MKRIIRIFVDTRSEVHVAILLGVIVTLSIAAGFTVGFEERLREADRVQVAKNPVMSKDAHILVGKDSLLLEDLPVTMGEMERTLSNLKNREMIETAYVTAEKDSKRDRIDDVIALVKRAGIEHIILETYSPPWINDDTNENQPLIDSRKILSGNPKIAWNPLADKKEPLVQEPLIIAPETQQVDLTQTVESSSMTSSVPEKAVQENEFVPTTDISPVVDNSSVKAMYQKEILEKIDRMKIYPPIARRMGHEGRVLVAFTLNKDGSIGNPVVGKKSGYGELDNAAMETVRKAAPFSAMPSGLGSSMEITVWINFNLGG